MVTQKQRAKIILGLTPVCYYDKFRPEYYIPNKDWKTPAVRCVDDEGFEAVIMLEAIYNALSDAEIQSWAAPLKERSEEDWWAVVRRSIENPREVPTSDDFVFSKDGFDYQWWMGRKVLLRSPSATPTFSSDVDQWIERGSKTYFESPPLGSLVVEKAFFKQFGTTFTIAPTSDGVEFERPDKFRARITAQGRWGYGRIDTKALLKAIALCCKGTKRVSVAYCHNDGKAWLRVKGTETGPMAVVSVLDSRSRGHVV